MRANALRAAVILMALLSVVVGQGTATSASPDAGAPPSPAQGLQCVSEAVPAGSDATPAPPVCFGTFRDAIRYATFGRVELPAEATTLTQSELDAAGVGRNPDPGIQSIIIGYSNDDDFLNEDWVHIADHGCDYDPYAEWQLNYVGDSWNDKIDYAVSGWNNCSGVYWEHVDFRGVFVATDWSYGAMEDRTSSIQWV